jgi:hypothetical protein
VRIVSVDMQVVPAWRHQPVRCCDNFEFDGEAAFDLEGGGGSLGIREEETGSVDHVDVVAELPGLEFTWHRAQSLVGSIPHQRMFDWSIRHQLPEFEHSHLAQRSRRVLPHLRPAIESPSR